MANYFISSMLCSPAGEKMIFLTQGVACRVRYLNSIAGYVKDKHHSPIIIGRKAVIKYVLLSEFLIFPAKRLCVCEISLFIRLQLSYHDSSDVGDCTAQKRYHVVLLFVILNYTA